MPCFACGAHGPEEDTPQKLFSAWAKHIDEEPPISYGLCCYTCKRQPFLDDMVRLETLDDQRAALASLYTGDLLLYQNADLGSIFNLMAMQSSFGHAGVVVELDPEVAKELYPPDYAEHLRPADPRMARLNVLEAVEGRGVCLFPLEARLARCIKYNRYLAVRRHEGEIGPEQRAAVLRFIEEVRGRGLAVAGTSPGLVRNVLRLYLPCLPMTPRSSLRVLSCGELVVETLLKLGVLPSTTSFTASSVLPTFLTTSDGVPGQLRIDMFTNAGHRFRKETLFLFPGAPIVAHLQHVKRSLATARRHSVSTSGGAAAAARRGKSRAGSIGSGALRRKATQAELFKEAIELL